MSVCESWLIYKHIQGVVISDNDLGLEAVEEDGEGQQHSSFLCRVPPPQQCLSSNPSLLGKWF